MSADRLAEVSLGKLTSSDERRASFLQWAPFVAFLLVIIPVPAAFLLLFLTSATTESAAVFLLFSFVSLGLSLVCGLLVLIALVVYRRRWLAQVRERLAADGITANEVSWFTSELTSEERKTWGELKQINPLLADAYCETLADRLTASRIIARARGEILKVERQINRTRNLRGVDTSKLMQDLLTDRERSDKLKREATGRLAEAKARLQTIEAAAHRSLSQTETDLMLRRLEA